MGTSRFSSSMNVPPVFGDASRDAPHALTASGHADVVSDQLDFTRLITDQATGAYNKFFMLECFTRELHLAQRSTAPLSLMLLHIDQLHIGPLASGSLATGSLATGSLATGSLATGSLASGSLTAQGTSAAQALVEVASQITNMVRRGDLLARFSPTTFALLCAQTRLQDAVKLAGRICRTVAHPDQAITLSIGVAEFAACRSDEANTFDARSLSTVLLAEAQQYLDRARRAGGNQVVSCGTSWQ